MHHRFVVVGLAEFHQSEPVTAKYDLEIEWRRFGAPSLERSRGRETGDLRDRGRRLFAAGQRQQGEGDQGAERAVIAHTTSR